MQNTIELTSVPGKHVGPMHAGAGVLLTLMLLLSACAGTDTRRSTGTVVDDAGIVAKVKAALVKNTVTDGLDIEVRVFRGRVQLNGFADSAAEVGEATAVARGVSGVQRVANNLHVVEQARRVGQYLDDNVLLTRVNAALAKDPAVSSLKIGVEVNRGVVLLGGFVDTPAMRAAAETAARRVTGIDVLKNHIDIR